MTRASLEYHVCVSECKRFQKVRTRCAKIGFGVYLRELGVLDVNLSRGGLTSTLRAVCGYLVKKVGGELLGPVKPTSRDLR